MNAASSKAVKRPATKAAQRESSIQRILDAALSRILARGYQATTVDDIAREAGMTKGAIYFYFQSKGAVLLALLDEIERMMVDSLVSRVEAAGPVATDQLVAAIHGQGIIAVDRSKYLILYTIALIEFAGAGDEIEKRLQEIYRRFCETMESIVEKGQRSGEFRDEINPKELAAIVVALEHGTLLEWHIRGPAFNGGELVRAARRVLLHGILAGGDTATPPVA